MDKNAFLSELANILDEAEIDETANLRDYPSWDSLAVLSIVALADSKFGFTLAFPEIKGIATAAELWNHFEKNRKK